MGAGRWAKASSRSVVGLGGSLDFSGEHPVQPLAMLSLTTASGSWNTRQFFAMRDGGMVRQTALGLAQRLGDLKASAVSGVQNPQSLVPLLG